MKLKRVKSTKMSNRFQELKERFSKVGWELTKQTRFYGIGYYAIEKGKEEYNDWKWVGSSLDSTSRSILIAGETKMREEIRCLR